MKAFLRTWRYGQDATLVYHGQHIECDAEHMLLVVDKPEIEGYDGVATVVTLTVGDELSVVSCNSFCDVASHEKKDA